MFDSRQMKMLYKTSVKELIAILSELPQNASVTICGDDYCFVHVETDGTVINIDNEYLEEAYAEQTDKA